MPIDLPKVRLLFEKANKTADVRFLTREIACRMHERLSVMKIDPLDILDAGCGDGDRDVSAAALTRKKKKYNDKIYQVGHPAGDGGKERIR